MDSSFERNGSNQVCVLWGWDLESWNLSLRTKPIHEKTYPLTVSSQLFWNLDLESWQYPGRRTRKDPWHYSEQLNTQESLIVHDRTATNVVEHSKADSLQKSLKPIKIPRHTYFDSDSANLSKFAPLGGDPTHGPSQVGNRAVFVDQRGNLKSTGESQNLEEGSKLGDSGTAIEDDEIDRDSDFEKHIKSRKTDAGINDGEYEDNNNDSDLKNLIEPRETDEGPINDGKHVDIGNDSELKDLVEPLETEAATNGGAFNQAISLDSSPSQKSGIVGAHSPAIFMDNHKDLKSTDESIGGSPHAQYRNNIGASSQIPVGNPSIRRPSISPIPDPLVNLPDQSRSPSHSEIKPITAIQLTDPQTYQSAVLFLKIQGDDGKMQPCLGDFSHFPSRHLLLFVFSPSFHFPSLDFHE